MSSPAIPDSLFFAEDFMLGSGMVIIQPSTGKIVLLHEEEKDTQGRSHHRWFLPKGRKDIGETLEQTALREAYEEVRVSSSLLSLCDRTGPSELVHRHRPSPTWALCVMPKFRSP